MLSYILKRLLLMIPTLIGVLTVTFIIIQFVPGGPVDQINYLVPSLSDGKVVWGAYFKTGAIFIADARGRIVRRIS